MVCNGIETYCCVHVGDCVKLLDDIVCATLTKNFCCKEGDLGLFLKQEIHSFDIKEIYL